MDFESLIPIVAIIMIFGIPIAAILTSHQRKMMEMMTQGQTDQSGQALLHEIHSLRRELESLRSQLNEQTLALDDLRTNRVADIQARVENS